MEGIIGRIRRLAKDRPEGIAYCVYDEVGEGFSVDRLSWKQLNSYSDALAGYLCEACPSKSPVVVFGHKSIYMLACFLACVKSGRAYCPVDVSVPLSRVWDIVECVGTDLVLATEPLDQIGAHRIIGPEQIAAICNQEHSAIDEGLSLQPEEVHYIIFTSGSTGKPKGVMITRACLENFIAWGLRLGGADMEGKQYRFLNQAPFSFDLSVMDTYLSLYSGGTLCAITKKIQGNTRLLYDVLRDADIQVWVSTPSFADVALFDPRFDAALLPNMAYFLFCGEILTNKTAEKLRERFPGAVVVNTYGPTESTVAVTEVVVDRATLEAYSPLPVGRPREGTWLYIMDADRNVLADGEPGEVVIVGDTVSVGYFNNPAQTEKAFGEREVGGRCYRFYHTGDRGYMKDGMLFYCGRMDFQIKLHGYRIEIEDIENNLVRIEGVTKAAVLPNYLNGSVRSLTGYVVYDGSTDNEFALAQHIRRELKHFLPDYMIPKKIKFMAALPMTNNGKVDRKALEDQSK